MSYLKNYDLFSEKKVYEPVNFNYDRIKQTSTITVLLDLPNTVSKELVTIKLPFTSYEPSHKYRLPSYTFRDDTSVFMNINLDVRIKNIGYLRCMPHETRYAYQCEYDEWIYNSEGYDRSGFIVWKAIKDYLLQREKEKDEEKDEEKECS